jgi:amino acid permease
MSFKDYLFPTIALCGGIIGVGIFSLPYIALQVGSWFMLAYFLVLAAIVALMHIIFSEICLKTPDFKRFPGFVSFHFGKIIGFLYLLVTVAGTYGVLLVYLIIGSSFLQNIFPTNLPGGQLVYALIFYVPICALIYFGIKMVAKAELGIIAFLLLILLLIFIDGFFKIKADNIFYSIKSLDIKTLFLPYGPIVFSLWGVGYLPEIEEMLGKNKKNIKKIVIAAISTVALLYLVFTLLVLSITGQKTTEAALLGLKSYLSPTVSALALFLGVITTFAGSVMLGLTLKKTFVYDLGIKNLHAWVFVCAVPLILFLLGLRSFLPLISFVGGVLLGIDGIFVLLMYRKIGGKNYFVYPLMLIFLLGIIYEIVYFAK